MVISVKVAINACFFVLDNSTRQIIKACRVIRICCGSTATLHDQMNKLLRDIKTSDRKGYLITMISSKLYEHCNSVITFCN